MKQLFYLTVILLSFVAVTGCEKNETDDPPAKTFEQLYPDFKDLSSIETQKYNSSTNNWYIAEYPQLAIKIVKNIATITNIDNATQRRDMHYDGVYVHSKNGHNYIEFTIGGGSLFYYEYVKNNDGTITLYSGLIDNNNYIYKYIYKMKKN